jgi:hypothetical protein
MGSSDIGLAPADTESVSEEGKTSSMRNVHDVVAGCNSICCDQTLIPVPVLLSISSSALCNCQLRLALESNCPCDLCRGGAFESLPYTQEPIDRKGLTESWRGP